MAARKSTTEMVQTLKRCIDDHVKAKCDLDRAADRERETGYLLSVAITELEQRALDAPKETP